MDWKKLSVVGIVVLGLGLLLWQTIISDSLTEDPCKDVTGNEIVGGDLIFSKKDLCYREYATTTGDVRWCSKSRVSGFEYDVRCAINVARVTGSIAICDKLPEDQARTRSQCLSEVAEEKNLPQLCSSIPDPYYQRRCEESIGSGA